MSDPLVEDDLLDDLMNIVHHNEEDNNHNDDHSQGSNHLHGVGGENSQSGNDEPVGEDESDDDENSIDELLEKPIDILDDKKDDQVNFYTYDKIQIKSNQLYFTISRFQTHLN